MMFGITPDAWLQYSALGVLGMGMMVASFIIYKIIIKLLDAQEKAREALQDVLQQNAAALSALQVTVAGLQAVMVGCQYNVATATKQEKDQVSPAG